MKLTIERGELKLDLRRSLLLSGYIGIVVAVISFVGQGLLVAAIGASAFIAFTFPSAQSSRARILIGGYICSGIWGLACRLWYVLTAGRLGERPALILFCVLAVFLSALTMTVLGLEHPSAISFTLSLVSSGSALQMAGIGLACILLLCVIRQAALAWITRRKKDAEPSA